MTMFPDSTPPVIESAVGSSFEVVFATAGPSLRRTAYLLLGSAAEAEELVQDVFAAALPRWDEISNPPGYLHAAVVHRAKNAFRRRDLERKHSRPSAVEAVDDLAELQHSLIRLPYRQRAVVVLRYYVGMADPEIAEILGCTRSTVRSSARRGLAQLRMEVTP